MSIHPAARAHRPVPKPERISHGEPTWFVRRAFAMDTDHHHDDRVAFWCAAPPGAQTELVTDASREVAPKKLIARSGR
ncbi:hypothetical protein ACVGVM_15800 [Pseudonocardia bannensis]|uniref:Uncharacterized protein n=1 Tax=Pseudonocardia bannensis TaxID=630973 RepID=A0A848DEG2_9PSEU|nr:hypothetical protein [Pseudonocardia bannensis]NMH90976.1 hypothetical protein [Pseudonocardia bannensis]